MASFGKRLFCCVIRKTVDGQPLPLRSRSDLYFLKRDLFFLRCLKEEKRFEKAPEFNSAVCPGGERRPRGGLIIAVDV